MERGEQRTWTRDGFVVSCDPDRLDIDVIHTFLSTSYWARGISRQLVERAIRGSLCFGLYAGDAQIGFARAITDRATFAYLSDVFVLEPHRGRGLGRFLVEVVRAHPELQNLRRFVLVTRDAHGLYEPFGFAPLASPELYLERFDPDVYARTAAPLSNTDGATPSAGQILTITTVLDEHDNAPSVRAPPMSGGSLCHVRVLEAGEGQLLRRLRLEALRESPHTFGERWEDASARTDAEWEEQARALAEPYGPRLFVVELEAAPVGLVLAVEDPSRDDVLRVGGMWVAPAARRHGAARSLLTAVLARGRTLGKRWLKLWVHEDAPAARACYAAFGFVDDGARKPFPRDPRRALISMELPIARADEAVRARP